MARQRTIFGFDRNVVLLGVTSLLNDTSSEMIYPLLPMFLTTVLGAGPAAVGLIEGIAETTASLLKLVSGWLSDRLGHRKEMVVGGYALAAVARPLVAIATAPWHVLLIRFGDRAGKGLRTAPRDALLAESSHQPTWGRSFGLHRAMDHLGAVLGPLLAFTLVTLVGETYRLVFAVAAIPGVAAVLVLIFGVRESAGVTARSAPPAATAALPRALWQFVATVFVFTLGNSTDAFLLLRAQDLGVPLAALPLLWGALNAVKSVSSIPGSGLSDRLGRRRVIILGWAVYATVYLGFAWATDARSVWLLFGAYGIFFGLTEGTEKALVADLVAPAHRGAAFGLYHLTVGVAALPSSLLFGLLWRWYGASVAFSVGAGFAAVAVLLFVVLVPTPAPPRGH